MTKTRFPPPTGRVGDARTLPCAGPPGQVPAVVRAAAMRAFALRGRDVRVLDLLTDNLVDGPSQGGPRRLRFLDVGQGVDVTVLVHELPQPGLVTLDIVLEPVSGRVAEVQNDEGPGALHEVGPGRWLAGPLQHGLTSIAIDGARSRLWSAWVRV